MNNFLAIDTSSRYLTVLAQKGGKRVLRHLPECAMKHSVILMDEVQAALSEAELSPSECDFFAAVVGPGSFTGIRIGIAAAKGFALGADKPLVSITSFDLIAYNVECESFCVAVDAAHGCYYVKGYGGKSDISPRYLTGEEVAGFGAPIFGFEDLPFEKYTKLDINDCLYRAVTESCKKPSREMRALYVRKSQAEEGAK